MAGTVLWKNDTQIPLPVGTNVLTSNSGNSTHDALASGSATGTGNTFASDNGVTFGPSDTQSWKMTQGGANLNIQYADLATAQSDYTWQHGIQIDSTPTTEVTVFRFYPDVHATIAFNLQYTRTRHLLIQETGQSPVTSAAAVPANTKCYSVFRYVAATNTATWTVYAYGTNTVLASVSWAVVGTYAIRSVRFGIGQASTGIGNMWLGRIQQGGGGAIAREDYAGTAYTVTVADVSASSDTNDDFTVDRGTTVNDTGTSTDAAAQKRGYSRLPADTSSSTDATGQVRTFGRTPADTSSSTDQVSVSLASGSKQTIGDTSTSTDQVMIRRDYVIAIHDTSTSTDAAAGTIAAAHALSDTSTSTDAATTKLDRTVAIFDLSTSTDSAVPDIEATYTVTVGDTSSSTDACSVQFGTPQVYEDDVADTSSSTDAVTALLITTRNAIFTARLTQQHGIVELGGVALWRVARESTLWVGPIDVSVVNETGDALPFDVDNLQFAVLERGARPAESDWAAAVSDPDLTSSAVGVMASPVCDYEWTGIFARLSDAPNVQVLEPDQVGWVLRT